MSPVGPYPFPLFKEECFIFLAIADLRELKLSASQMTNWSSFRLNARHEALILDFEPKGSLVLLEDHKNIIGLGARGLPRV